MGDSRMTRAPKMQSSRNLPTGPDDEDHKGLYVFPIPDVASYVATILTGIRAVTVAGRDKDMRFLDYLLAVAESQAHGMMSRRPQTPEEDLRSRRRTLKSSRRVLAASREAPSSKASRISGSTSGSSTE